MILLKNVLLQDQPAHILVDGGRIARISREPFVVPGAEETDCRGKAVIPGFFNMHTHAAMILLRGIHEDLSLYDWLNNIWKIEAGLDKDFIYWGTQAACLEMIKSGTTTFNDQYWFCPHARRAALEMGMRPVVSFIFLDSHNPEMVLRQRDACQRLWNRVQAEWGDGSLFAISIHSVYTVSEENILWANNFALEHGLKVHLHLAETALEDADCRKAHNGLSPTAYFDHLGILGPHVIAAHSLHLDDNDVDILGKRGVNCVHNINSNLKLSSGFRFRYNELRDAGVNVCIGTDGAASSNNLDLLEHMKNMALLQKAWRGNPAEMPLQELMDCATVHGAKALGLDSGVIREGALADLSLVDITGVPFLSPGPVAANLVYAAHSDVITDVMVEGKWVMRGRHVPGEEQILEGARSVLKQIKH
ncbi:MAG: amidohydrolase [Bacteroidales bacterium]|nr:amidohydrolase [Bacteroidales bacterium]